MSDDKKDVTEDSETEEENTSEEEETSEEENSSNEETSGDEGAEDGKKEDEEESEDDAADDDGGDEDADDADEADADESDADEANDADPEEASEEAEDDDDAEDDDAEDDDAEDDDAEDAEDAAGAEGADDAGDEDDADAKDADEDADEDEAEDEEDAEAEDEGEDEDEDEDEDGHDHDHHHDDHAHDDDVLGVAAFFDHPDHLIYAAGQAREASYERYDAFSPFPIHGMDDAMGLGRSWIPWVTFLAGVTGFSTANFIEFGVMWYDWPMVFGGKPFAAWPSFVPVMFELTVLLAGVTTAVVMLYAAGCFRKPMIIDPGITNDRFVLWVSADDERFSQDGVVEFMKGLNPMEIRTVRKEGES